MSANESHGSPWLTIQEACTIAKVGPKLLYSEIRRHRLRAARLGGRREIRLHREWLDLWLNDSSKVLEIKK